MTVSPDLLKRIQALTAERNKGIVEQYKVLEEYYSRSIKNRSWNLISRENQEKDLLRQCPFLEHFPELVKFMLDDIGGINGIYEFRHVATGLWRYHNGWTNIPKDKP